MKLCGQSFDIVSVIITNCVKVFIFFCQGERERDERQGQRAQGEERRARKTSTTE